MSLLWTRTLERLFGEARAYANGGSIEVSLRCDAGRRCDPLTVSSRDGLDPTWWQCDCGSYLLSLHGIRAGRFEWVGWLSAVGTRREEFITDDGVWVQHPPPDSPAPMLHGDQGVSHDG